ncbi:hypothetical protein D3C71_1685640 [compost metagenome]
MRSTTPPGFAFVNYRSPLSVCWPRSKARRTKRMPIPLIRQRPSARNGCSAHCSQRSARYLAWLPRLCPGVRKSHRSRHPARAPGLRRRWSEGVCWQPSAIARCATQRQAARPMRAGWPCRRLSGRCTAATSHLTRKPGLAVGPIPRSSGPCAMASVAMARICIRHFLTLLFEISTTPICRRCTRT